MPALAHSPIDGIEGFYTGLLHPLSSAGQVLVLLALGLAVGCAGKAVFAPAWGVFAALAVTGIVWGQVAGLTGHEETALIGVALVTCVVIAAAPPASRRDSWFPPVIVAAVAGLLLGLASTPEDGPTQATLITVVGSFTGLNFALIYAAGSIGWLRDRYTQPWALVGFRVMASWVAAVALIMGALMVGD